MTVKRHRIAARRVLACALGLTALGAATACSGGSSSGGSGPDSGSQQSVAMRLDFVHTGKDAIWTYGIEKGYFKDAGIDLTVQDGKGSATTGQTVGNGSDKIGLVDSGTLITLAAKGVPVKAIASVFAQSPLAVLSPEKKPINTPQDLVGSKIAITSGDGPSTLLPALLSKNGIDPSKLTTVNLQPQAKLTSLLSGNVDAVATITLVQATLQAQSFNTHAMLYNAFGVKTPGYYLVTSNGYLTSNNALLQKFVQATQKSLKATMDAPSAAIDSFIKAYPEYKKDRATAELNLLLPLIPDPDTSHPLGWMSPELATSTGELLKQYGGLTNPKPVNTYLTNEFIK